jgi:hypothetical protein
MKVDEEYCFYLRGDKEKVIEIEGIKIVINKKERFSEIQLIDVKRKIYRASLELAILENLIVPKQNKTKVLREEELLNIVIERKKDFDLEKIERISSENNWKIAKERFFRVYRKIKKSELVKEDDNYLIKYELEGLEIDKNRIKMFEALKNELLNLSDKGLKEKSIYFEDERFNKNYCFWESYFSNYIEGTKFAPKEALEIIER